MNNKLIQLFLGVVIIAATIAVGSWSLKVPNISLSAAYLAGVLATFSGLIFAVLAVSRMQTNHRR